MAMYDSEQFWQDFMRRPDAQKALKLEQKMLIKEHACSLSNEYDRESAQLKEALLSCSQKVKAIVKPIVKYQMVHRILYNLLKDCETKGMNFNDELLREDSTITRQLTALHNEWKADPENISRIEEKWSNICLEAKSNVTTDSYKPNNTTWEDIPKDELAERLSKGEIMPRDEWIPGLSKGKRKLDSNSLKQHLTLGEQMRRDGREAYQNKDYELALTRFTQGVELLNWVTGTNDNDNSLVEEMYACHLRNQAQAAFMCENYNQALKACTILIQEIDEHDGKARYRRGKAYAMLGMVKCAKDDYLFIVKSPYCDRDSINAAKAGIRELRSLVSKYKTNAKSIVEQTLQNDLFSDGREIEEKEEQRKALLAEEKRKDMNKRMPIGRRITRDWFQRPPTRTTTSQSDDEEELNTKRTVNGSTGMHKYNDDANEFLPMLDAPKTKEMLEEFLELYTSDDIQREIENIRRLADYDERRVLIRIRKYLPELQKPILHRYNFANAENQFDYQDARNSMQSTVSYWRKRDEEINQLAKECWDSLFGDIQDLDF